MRLIMSLFTNIIYMAAVILGLAVIFSLIKKLMDIKGSASGKGKGGKEADASDMGTSAQEIDAVKVSMEQTAAVRDPQMHESVQANGLQLVNVDERTAAMIMAIVSHETKTPLDQMVFRSISQVK
jgi:hypothetical protein